MLLPVRMPAAEAMMTAACQHCLAQSSRLRRALDRPLLSSRARKTPPCFLCLPPNYRLHRSHRRECSCSSSLWVPNPFHRHALIISNKTERFLLLLLTFVFFRLTIFLMIQFNFGSCLFSELAPLSFSSFHHSVFHGIDTENVLNSSHFRG